MKTLKVLLLVLLCSNLANAQILHTERFSVILDTSKAFKGNILPSFNYQNLKSELIEFSTTSDFSIRIKEHGITIANNFQLSKFGDETIQGGGYAYLEYRSEKDTSRLSIEPYVQMHWEEVRGLELKYAGGVNLRVKLIEKKNTGFFFGIGGFYEFERWDYRGVPDDRMPMNPVDVESELLRIGSYISFKQNLGEQLVLDLSYYYQDKMGSPFQTPRQAASTSITYKFTRYLGLTLLYQNIYDPKPLVPIDKLFNDVSLSLSIEI